MSKLSKSCFCPENPRFPTVTKPPRPTTTTTSPPELGSVRASFGRLFHPQRKALSEPVVREKSRSARLRPQRGVARGLSEPGRGCPARSVPHRGHRGDRVEPSRGFPRLGGSRRAPHRPPPPRVRPGALPAAAPRPLAVPAARPYLHGAPERVESTVQQQGGPATAEQPQKLPEQHPSWAGGRGSGLRATWGRSRASRRQRRWLAPIPGAPPSQL